MILYCAMPHEIVLEGFSEHKPSYEEIPGPGGSILQVETLKNRQYRIVRLISCNPEHYLDPNLQPGVILN